jgi:hypothetical protein
MSGSDHLKISGTFGSIETGAYDQSVLIDVNARNYDVNGYLHKQSAFLRLSVNDAYRIHAYLGRAIVAAEEQEPRQSGLWSNSTTFQRVRA